MGVKIFSRRGPWTFLPYSCHSILHQVWPHGREWDLNMTKMCGHFVKEDSLVYTKMPAHTHKCQNSLASMGSNLMYDAMATVRQIWKMTSPRENLSGILWKRTLSSTPKCPHISTPIKTHSRPSSNISKLLKCIHSSDGIRGQKKNFFFFWVRPLEMIPVDSWRHGASNHFFFNVWKSKLTELGPKFDFDHFFLQPSLRLP